MSEQVREQVLAAVTDEWASAREIWQRIGYWAPETVRNYLRMFVHEGVVETQQVQHDSARTITQFRKAKP